MHHPTIPGPAGASVVAIPQPPRLPSLSPRAASIAPAQASPPLGEGSVPPPRASQRPSMRPSVLPCASVPAVALASMLLTQGCYGEVDGEDQATPVASVSEDLRIHRRDAELPTDARGIWVWGTTKRLDDPRAAETILETCRTVGLNEVYLSVGNGALRHPNMPALVKALYRAGIRVEALMGDVRWYQPEHRAEMLAAIDDVVTFNALHGGRIAAIHLDIEPHQLVENRGDHAWLPELAEALSLARARAADAGLSTSADLPRFAFDEHGPLFARAVQRPFVMLYQLRDPSNEWLGRQSGAVIAETYLNVPAEVRGRMVVAVRVEDYGSKSGDTAKSLGDAHGANRRYGGWAIHDEAKLRAALATQP